MQSVQPLPGSEGHYSISANLSCGFRVWFLNNSWILGMIFEIFGTTNVEYRTRNRGMSKESKTFDLEDRLIDFTVRIIRVAESLQNLKGKKRNFSISWGRLLFATIYWIPAFAGMTGGYIQTSFPRRRESIDCYPDLLRSYYHL